MVYVFKNIMLWLWTFFYIFTNISTFFATFPHFYPLTYLIIKNPLIFVKGVGVDKNSLLATIIPNHKALISGTLKGALCLGKIDDKEFIAKYR